MTKLIDLAGRRFGRLTVVSRELPNAADGSARWLCLCDCGGYASPSAMHLKSGHTNSCGCYMRQRLAESKTIHGHKPRAGKSKTYQSWSCMHQRCSNKDWHAYKHYGGRGVSVCERWSVFDHFLEDMGERPDGMTLDRIDVDGGYSKDNCRWADAATQAGNKRHSKLGVMRQ